MSRSSPNTPQAEGGYSEPSLRRPKRSPLIERLRWLLGGRGRSIPQLRVEPVAEMPRNGVLSPAAEDVVRPLAERLDAIEQRMAEVSQQTQSLPVGASIATAQGLVAIQQALAALEKQINRAGREQLKANSLVEAQMEQTSAALEMLGTAEARHEGEIATLREQNRAAQVAARLDVVRAMLPALDGLDEALRSGHQLLERSANSATPSTFMERLNARLAGPQQADASLRENMASWLAGLTFVRQRLFDVLAAEGVQPMVAEGQLFDPQRHIALDVVPATNNLPPGTVATELRRGYLVGDKVLRHAEVAVSAQAEKQET